MCRCEGYGFQAVYSRIGCINQSVWVQNRVSFFRKLISWLKILSRLGTQLLQDRGIWGVYSSIGQQNLAELALVQVKGSRVPVAHPHPEIPKVAPPPGRSIVTENFCVCLYCVCIDGTFEHFSKAIRPISNVVLLPCRTQLIELNSSLARQQRGV